MKARKTKKRESSQLPWYPPRVEGVAFVMTDFGTVNVSEETEAWCLEHHANPRLKPSTVLERANRTSVAIACYMARKAWEAGDECVEI